MLPFCNEEAKLLAYIKNAVGLSGAASMIEKLTSPKTSDLKLTFVLDYADCVPIYYIPLQKKCH